MEQFKRLKNKTILLVEDEDLLRANIGSMLKYFFKDVYMASNGIEGLDQYEKYLPDIVMTDLKMPSMGGFELLDELKNRSNKSYTVIVSAHTDTELLLDAINQGVNRYIIKPVTEKKLFETFESFLEHIDQNSPQTIEIDDIVINLESSSIQTKDELFHLSKKEALLLKLLSSNKEKSFSYEEIEYQIWGEKSMSLSALRTVVRDLRKKLGNNFIKNISGSGYKFQ